MNFHPRILWLIGSLLPYPALQAAEPVEEITITAPQASHELQLAIDLAEDDFYKLFNSLVDKDMQVSCTREKVLGSLIKQRVCQTNYMKDELTKAAMFSQMEAPYDASAALRTKNRELSVKARELIGENPELSKAAARLSNLVERYQDLVGQK
ncbi:MAG: hypothetical protein V4603_13050 [Pseudomonadota bacterium]